MSKRGTVIFAIAIVIAGVGGRVLAPWVRGHKLAPRQLPGFTLALPHGKVARDESDYARGMFMTVSDGDVFGAQWAPSDGEPMSSEQLAVVAQIFAGGLGKMPKGKATQTSVDGPDGKPLGGIHIGEDMWITMALCGARSITLMTMASHGGEKLHRHMVKSLVCAPDAAKEALVKQTGSALVLDLPGWWATEKTPERIQLSDGKALVMLQFATAHIETAMLPTVMAPLLKTQGIAATFAPPRDGRVDFSMKVDGQDSFGWGRVFHCAKSTETMIVFAESEAAARSLWTRVGNARCRRDGEAAQTWPDAPKPSAQQ